MRDLDFAKQQLKERKLALVIVKGGKVLFETGSPGIRGFFSAIEVVGEELAGASVADKVVGRAVALLCVCSHVKEVFAVVLSKEGLKALEEHGLRCEYENLVPKILDAKGVNMCPFERFALTISNPKKAYEKLKSFASSLLRK